MPRLKQLDPASLSEEQQWAVQRFVDGRIGAVRGPSDMWLRSAKFADLARQMVEFVRYDTSLPREVVELAILVTGAKWKAQVEFWGHARMAREAGIAAEVIEAIRVGERPKLDRADLQATYDFVSEYFATNRVSAATYARALAELGEQGMVEVIAASGMYGLVAMTLNVFEAELPAGAKAPFEE